MISKYKILVTGKNPDYFVKELIKKNIAIYSLEKRNRQVILIVDSDGMDRIKGIKTSYKYKILDCYGPIKIKNVLKRYLIFIFCFLFGVVLNIFLSSIIFDVEVIHSNEFIRELVYRDLKQLGISRFHFKVSYEQKEKIVSTILKKEKENIEWLEIEEVGTKYTIKVEQRKKNAPIEECVPRNIVAKKNAMILDIQADSGEIVRKKLDYVKKGDIIISGTIYNKEEVVSKKCAIGKVYGEVWYQVRLEVPKKYREEKVTGKQKTQLEIVFLDKSFTLLHKFKTYQKNSIPLLSFGFLPISINLSKYLETSVVEKNYTFSNVDNFAMEEAINKLKTKFGDDIVILSKNVLKKVDNNSKIIIEIFIKVKEDITDVQVIEDISMNGE